MIRRKHYAKCSKKKLAKALIGIGLVLIGIILIIDLRIRPIIKRTSVYQSKTAAVRLINSTVYDIIQNKNYSYDSFCEIITSEDNTISYVRAKAYEINLFKAQVTNKLQTELLCLKKEEFGVHLGTLSGVQVLYGRGPFIKIEIFPRGTAQTKLISQFESAGINQTIHRIKLEVSVNITAFVPGYTSSSNVETEYIISETVILGKVPDSYTVLGESDISLSV